MEAATIEKYAEALKRQTESQAACNGWLKTGKGRKNEKHNERHGGLSCF